MRGTWRFECDRDLDGATPNHNAAVGVEVDERGTFRAVNDNAFSVDCEQTFCLVVV